VSEGQHTKKKKKKKKPTTTKKSKNINPQNKQASNKDNTRVPTSVLSLPALQKREIIFTLLHKSLVQMLQARLCCRY
jgi:hypothetical protein